MSQTIRRIGASKLATVSEYQTSQGRHIALKEYNRQSLTPLQRERIFGAAERWKKLSLTGLVPYWDVSPEQSQLTMELLDRSAAIRLREGPSDPRLVLHTVRGLLFVLAQLHEQGLLHVNLKPTNVFFDTDGRVRLSDGLLVDARLPVALPPAMNLKYTAPEQSSSDFGPISPTTDLYCVGLLALEMLAGDRFARAFQGIRGDATDDDTAWSQWHASSQAAPQASLFAKGCPDELAGVIARLVSKQPSLRYATARQALQDLPNDITGQATTVPTSKAAVTEKKREALSSHVISRPATGIVLAIASGSRTGEMIGSNENELMVGFDHDCFLRFSRDQSPYGGGKVLMRRGPQGWYALRVSGDTAFVNQHALEEKCPLRSGDIVRLSSRGPDVQFTMQSGGVAIRSLVERFLPSQSQRPLSPQGLAAAASSAASAVGPHGTVVSAPARAAAAGKSTPQSVAPVESANSVPTTNASPPNRSTAQPLVQARPAQPAPGQRVSGVTARDQLRDLSFSWLNPQSWSAMLRNIMLGIVGAMLVILTAGLLTLFFASETQTDGPPLDDPTRPSDAGEMGSSESAEDLPPADMQPASPEK